MRQRNTTSWDVARRAGVSRTTVSMVLNNSNAGTISEDTKARVRLAAEELNYKPNSAARMLVSGQAETIGLIISDTAILTSDGFIPQLMHGISQVNRDYGYHVLLEGLEADAAADPYKSLVESRRIDGMIVLNPQREDANLRALIDSDYPVVLIGSIRHPQEYAVNFATRTGIEEAVGLLARLGHRHVGSVPFSSQGSVATDVRLAILKKAAAAQGMQLRESHIEHANFTVESGYDATTRLLQRHPEITAILAGNDTVAIGAIKAAEEIGRPVPAKMSIVGFDDLPFAKWLNPSLTTIRVDGIEQGVLAARLLVGLLKGEKIARRQISVPVHFVERKSCAAPP